MRRSSSCGSSSEHAPQRADHADSLENAIASCAATGGSTNAVLHLLAIAREAGVPLTIDDFDTVAARTPVIADLKPGGRFTAVDLHRAGGVALVVRRLAEAGLLAGRADGERADALRGGARRDAKEARASAVVRTASARRSRRAAASSRSCAGRSRPRGAS